MGETEVRDGAKLDSVRLETLLEQLGFKVTLCENFTKEVIKPCHLMLTALKLQLFEKL